MTLSPQWIDPATLACMGLAAAALALGAGEARRGLRVSGAALLLLGSLALLASLALPSLLPLRPAELPADGATGDPRVLSALVAGLAACAAMLPGWSALGLAPLASAGAALPGLGFAAVFGALAYFAGLSAPMGLAGIALGAFAMGTANVLAFRRKPRSRGLWLPVQGFGVGVLVVAGMLSMHGPRATGLAVSEGAPADTLGLRVSLARVESPAPNLRVMTVGLRGANDSLTVRPRLEGEEGKAWRSVADAPLFSGPIALPVTLRTERTGPHEIQWLAKQASLRAGDATIRFTGFRIEKTDSLRMFADLDVTTAAGTEKVSPGVIATKLGERPFAAMARGFGPIAVARFDPDNHRVGLMLPVVAVASNRHTLVLDLRQRPGLPFAWAGTAMVVVGFLLGLVYQAVARRKA